MTPAEVPEVEWLLLLSHFLCMATCEKRVSHKQSITEEEWRVVPPLLPWCTNNHGRKGGAKWLTR
jgi:hypothetical protein